MRSRAARRSSSRRRRTTPRPSRRRRRAGAASRSAPSPGWRRAGCSPGWPATAGAKARSSSRRARAASRPLARRHVEEGPGVAAGEGAGGAAHGRALRARGTAARTMLGMALILASMVRVAGRADGGRCASTKARAGYHGRGAVKGRSSRGGLLGQARDPPALVAHRRSGRLLYIKNHSRREPSPRSAAGGPPPGGRPSGSRPGRRRRPR